MAVRDKRIPLELQELFIKREFAERYGFMPEKVDKLSMRYVNGFRAIEIAQQNSMERDRQNMQNGTNNQGKTNTRHFRH